MKEKPAMLPTEKHFETSLKGFCAIIRQQIRRTGT